MDYLASKISEDNLYQLEFDDGHVVWRLLPWNIFKKYREAANLLGDRVFASIEDEVYNSCVIFSTYDDDPPDDIEEDEYPLFLFDSRNHQPAGIISTVVKSILRHSGANNPEALMSGLEEFRPYVFDLEEQLLVTICRAFPAYKPEEIEAMDWQTILKRVTQAEAVLMGRQVELPFSTADSPKQQKAPPKEQSDLSRKRAMKQEYLRQRGF